MDLREFRNKKNNRHPWELSRVKALKLLLKSVIGPNSDLNALDIGCGDTYVSRELFKESDAASKITCVDINLSDEQVTGLSRTDDSVSYQNVYPDPKEGQYNLILLLDVIEHIDDDKEVLSGIVEDYLAVDGHALITVPAFQFLFSAHDRFLEHYRRYSLKELTRVLDSAGLECLSSGYLFSSLLLPRLFSVYLQKFIAPRATSDRGVGSWDHGRFVTKTLELFLRADNRLSITLSRFGIRLPGLTGWVICRRRQS